MNPRNIQLQLPPDVVSRLIEQGQLKIEDFRCCDTEAKQLIKHMYLSATKRALQKTPTI